jgi:hypothetical protein
LSLELSALSYLHYLTDRSLDYLANNKGEHMLKTAAIVLSVILLVMVTEIEVEADEFKVTSSVGLKGEYNDNIFFSETERLDLNLAGFLHVIEYAHNDELSGTDYDGRGRLKYSLAPRLLLNAGALYDKSTQPDRDVVETGLIQNDKTRRRQRYNGGLEYVLSEKAAAALSYLFQDDNWDSNDPDDEDLTLNSADMLLTYDLSGTFESTVGRLNFGYANADYETATIDYYFGTLGFVHHFSEIYSIQLDAGGRYTDSEFENNRSDQRWGGRGILSLIYTGEFSRVNLSASHDVDAASGRSGAVERTAFVLDAHHQFLEKLWPGVSAGYYLNKSSRDEFSSDKIDEQMVRVRPRILWEIHRYVSLEGAYEFVYVKDDADNTDTDRNKVYLQLTFAYPVID